MLLIIAAMTSTLLHYGAAPAQLKGSQQPLTRYGKGYIANAAGSPDGELERESVARPLVSNPLGSNAVHRFMGRHGTLDPPVKQIPEKP